MSDNIHTIETVEAAEDDVRENETRHEAFVRIAQRRTNQLLGQLALLEGMAKSSNYEYEAEEIARMFAAIDSAYGRVKMRFELNITAKTPSQARGGFKF
jgi:hypothetical protein